MKFKVTTLFVNERNNDEMEKNQIQNQYQRENGTRTGLNVNVLESVLVQITFKKMLNSCG